MLAWSDTGINTVGVDVMQIKLPWDGATLEDFIEGLNPQVRRRCSIRFSHLTLKYAVFVQGTRRNRCTTS